jgi:hypothetical protein
MQQDIGDPVSALEGVRTIKALASLTAKHRGRLLAEGEAFLMVITLMVAELTQSD